mgnify:CR=1 FL=1
MLFFSRWIQKRRKKRQLIKDTESREVERRNHQEERNDQQARALLLTLCKLQRAMDPLIAAQIYNSHFCPLISRLPEELLLCMFDFLCDDDVALLRLRIVLRIFLRPLNNQPVRWGEARSIRGKAFYLHDVPRLQFRQLLQRDGRCDNCRHWNDACGHQLFDDCKFQQDLCLISNGVLDHLLYSRLHCYTCHSLHDVCQSSSTYQQSWKHQPKRRCLGQQGSVQLYAHIQIT